MGLAVGASVGASVGAAVGAGVGAGVAKQLVLLDASVTKPSRHSHVYKWVEGVTTQCVDRVSQPCVPSLQSCFVGE